MPIPNRKTPRWAGLALALAIVTAGCSSSQPSQVPTSPGLVPSTIQSSDNTRSPTAPSSAPYPSAAAIDTQGPALPTFPPYDPRSIGDALFTAPADPLTLTPGLDPSNAVTQLIGSDGGVITTTGTDGTKLTLSVPKEALPLAIPITLTPITTLTGFPGGTAPESNVGASLEPEGLQMAQTATLSIEPAVVATDKPVYAMSFYADGSDAGFKTYEQSGTKFTMSVDHFSGYVVDLGFFIASTRPTDIQKYMTQSEVEKRLESEAAYWVSFLRQRSLYGAEPPAWTLLDLARYVLTLYKRLVISPRVAIADKSCENATAAMSAYLTYQRQRQLLGVTDDPDFDLVGAGLLVPQDLVDLSVSVCFKAAYDKCVATGDFTTLALYFLAFWHQISILGAEPPQGAEASAKDYLQRCGRWRVRLSSTVFDPFQPGTNATYTNESTREFFVQWTPGQGPFGAYNSTIEGSGPVDTTKVAYTGVCIPRISETTSKVNAKAQITSLVFDRYEGPTLTSNTIPPVPRSLGLAVNLGQSFHVAQCLPYGARREINEYFEWVYPGIAQEQGKPFAFEDLNAIIEDGATQTVDKNWQFRTNPFKATYVMAEQVDEGTGLGIYQQVRLEATVEHEPQ